MQYKNQHPETMDPTTLGTWSDPISGNMLLHPVPKNQNPPSEEDSEEDNEFGDYDLETDDFDLGDDPASMDQEESYPGLSEEDLDEED